MAGRALRKALLAVAVLALALALSPVLLPAYGETVRFASVSRSTIGYRPRIRAMVPALYACSQSRLLDRAFGSGRLRR